MVYPKVLFPPNFVTKGGSPVQPVQQAQLLLYGFQSFVASHRQAEELLSAVIAVPLALAHLQTMGYDAPLRV